MSRFILTTALVALQAISAVSARAQQMSPLCTSIVDRAEVLRSPGGVQDVQRVIQNLACVGDEFAFFPVVGLDAESWPQARGLADSGIIRTGWSPVTFALDT